MVAGPFQRIPLDGGSTADLFLLRYDEAGRLRSPRTERILKDDLSGVSDVFLFSHGWNNTFTAALERYRGFIAGYIEQRRNFGVPMTPEYRPVLAGIVWPSTSFVMPWEAGPHIAADPRPDDHEAHQVEELLRFVTESLDPAADAEFTELIDGRTELDSNEAFLAAEIALEALWHETDPDEGARPPDAGEFLESWAQLDGGAAHVRADPDDFGTIHEASSPSKVSVAGGCSLDPRNLLRAATLWKMKARAGVVGATGVGPLVWHVLQHSGARLHLIGHSFGARLLLSALTSQVLPRSADSLLLLQPAVNRWCFALNVAETGRPGGYQPVLERVEKPVLTTFSPYDDPLTKYFHLALRGGHLGEPSTAGFGDTDLYGALGGFGPSGLGLLSETESAAAPNMRGYGLDSGRRVIAIDGGALIDGKPAITGHGDISNPTTWWALHCLTQQN